jgi:signal transduction histidine kinase
MWEALLLALLLLSLAGLLWFGLRERSLRRSLRELSEQLEEIRRGQGPTQVLHLTSLRELQLVLAEINLLLRDKQQSSADFRRSEAAMRRMLSNISHDLKTPLTVMIGYLETLQHQRDLASGERDELIEKVYQKGLELSQMLNRFFELALLEAGDRELPLEPILLNEFCAQRLLSLYDLPELRTWRVEIDIPEQPLFVLGNSDALQRVLDNLFSNVLRYGSAGKMFGFRLYTEQDQVCCEVIDQGEGIAQSHGERIFERLYMANEARTRPSQGSGLGLSISKRLVELMQGTLSYRSQPGVETVFSLRLPRYYPEGRASERIS